MTAKNRYYWMIQVLIGALGSRLSTQHWMVRKLVQYRAFPDDLIEDKQEAELDGIVEEACGVLSVDRASLEHQADSFQKSLQRVDEDREGLERKLFLDGEDKGGANGEENQ